MCTLVIGLDVDAKRTTWIAANRDEDPRRPAAPPGVLCARPRVIGGRDLVAGGTWLALREERAVVAMLNRRPSAGARRPDGVGSRPPRSRGLLALAVAACEDTGEPLADRALVAARAELATAEYAPFSMACVTRERAWILSHDGGDARVRDLEPGWHVITHADLDDRSEPRTAWLLEELGRLESARREAPSETLARLLAAHGVPGDPTRPPVCIHEGPMVTVSSARIVLAPEATRWFHLEGRPCEGSWTEVRMADLAPAPGGSP